jgi:transposase
MKAEVLKYSLGIDVSKKTLAVCLCALDAGLHVSVKASRSFDNSPKGHGLMKDWLTKHTGQPGGPLTCVMEATGVYHEACAAYLHGQGLRVSVVVPSQARRYQQSLGTESKTDCTDAKSLARMGAERELATWCPPDPQVAGLRKLSRHHQMLQEMQTEVRNRLHAEQHSASPNKLVVEQLKQQMKMLEKQEEKLAQAMEKALDGNSQFSQKARKIAGSIKGLGTLAVAAIAAEASGFELFESQGQLVSYAGYDVVENQSGARRGKTRISKKGNSHIRRALHFPALNVVRYGVGAFPGLYGRVYERTKVKMKGYVAVQRKLLCLIYTLWKKDEAFVPSYQPKGHRISQSLSPLFVV